jgi:hypothetical protein
MNINKKIILGLLLLVGAVNMQGQDIPVGPKMVVMTNMVNIGNVVSTIPIDLRETVGVKNTIDNQENGNLYTSALKVGVETKVNNAGFLCIGCNPLVDLPPDVSIPCSVSSLYPAYQSVDRDGIELEVSATGAGLITYMWQSRRSSDDEWSDVNYATATSAMLIVTRKADYEPPMWVRCKVTTTCEVLYSSEIRLQFIDYQAPGG